MLPLHTHGKWLGPPAQGVFKIVAGETERLDFPRTCCLRLLEHGENLPDRGLDGWAGFVMPHTRPRRALNVPILHSLESMSLPSARDIDELDPLPSVEGSLEGSRHLGAHLIGCISNELAHQVIVCFSEPTLRAVYLSDALFLEQLYLTGCAFNFVGGHDLALQYQKGPVS